MINKRQAISLILVFSLLFTLSGCATMPPGPSVSVMPPPGKSFDEFRADDAICRQWAAQQTGQTAQDAANQSAVKSAALGTILTAGLGAVIGAAVGHWGTGAAIGAASGLLLGTAAGAGASQASGYAVQRRYDVAYMQCMYAKGNLLPGMTVAPVRRYSAPPPPPDYAPESSDNVPPDYKPGNGK
ncbi:MAG: glycine zipper family protein [Dissulfurispiraceae bacterium]